MIIRGTFQMIAGKPSELGLPDTWEPEYGPDDWVIPEGAQIVVTMPEGWRETQR